MDYFVTDFKNCLTPIIIFLTLFAIDFISGLCKGIFVEGVSSSKLRMSVPKFVGYFGMILMCILLDTLIITSTEIEYAPIGLICCVCFCIIEVSSIIENARALGINIPPVVTNVIDYIKTRLFNDKEQKGGGSGVTFTSWVNKYIGKKTDWDGVYGVQCVDLIDCYIADCLALKKGFWGNAKYWWLNRNKSAWLKNNFDFITPSYKNGELKTGDIGIRTSGTYGHIFIVKEPTANGKVKYYDQNADGKGTAMTLREKPYTSSYINGILRPKNQSNLKVATASAPVYNKGSRYILTAAVNVWTQPTTTSQIKRVKDLTADGRKNATSKNPNANAVLKAGTIVDAQAVSADNAGNIWLKIPSGYIAVYYKDKKRANWYNK